MSYGKIIDVRFVFEVDENDMLQLKWIQRIENSPTISPLSVPTEEQYKYLAEMWAQSDRYHVDISQSLLDVIGDGDVYRP